MLDINELNKMIDEKLVIVQKHKKADYFIYNYGPKAQYERIWNEITLQCRGLILDSNYNVVARPFRKFFNLEEHTHDDIPKTSFEVYEKMDGSLGILYWIGDMPHIATRGSFESDQAIYATNILHNRYKYVIPNLDKSKTYLFEIIYPENRIVVNYGNVDDLVLLAVIDKATGLDCELEPIGFPIVKRYDGIQDISQLKKLEENNKEGFVVKFQNGFRLKVKFDDYVRLHRILTNVSSRTIWQHLVDGNDFAEILERVPDEFYDWVKETRINLERNYRLVEEESNKSFHRFFHWKMGDTRAEFAAYAKKQKYPAILFKMLDKKSYDNIIWKIIEPKYEKPFIKNIEI
jgi:RNA ligase